MENNCPFPNLKATGNCGYCIWFEGKCTYEVDDDEEEETGRNPCG